MSLIKQSAQLTALAAQQAAELRDVEKAGTSPEALHQKGKTVTSVFTFDVLVSEKQIISLNPLTYKKNTNSDIIYTGLVCTISVTEQV